MKKLLLVPAILALVLGGTSACATKKYVQTRVGEVNDKVETLSKSVEDNQERTRKNEEAITETNQKVGQVDQKAEAANRSAADARNAANSAASKADAVDKASKRIIYEVTLTEDPGRLQIREGDAAGRSSGTAGRDRQPVEGEPERRLHRGGGVH